MLGVLSVKFKIIPPLSLAIFILKRRLHFIQQYNPKRATRVPFADIRTNLNLAYCADPTIRSRIE